MQSVVELRVYRAGSLLGELELTGDSVEIGDRPGDAVRWDELGLAAEPGWGGSLRREGTHWTFVSRLDPGAAVESLSDPDRLLVGDGHIELALRDGDVLDVASLPDDDALPVSTNATASGPGAAGERLHLLAGFLADLESGSTSEEVLRRALDGAFQLVDCERGLVALRTPDGQGLRVVAARDFDHDEPRRALSRRVLAVVLDEGSDVVTGNAPVDYPTVTLDLQSIRVICALPLRGSARVEGVLYVDRGVRGTPFSDEDLAFLRLLAALVGRRLEESARYRQAESERRRLAGTLATRDAGDEADLAWGSPAMRRVHSEAARLLRAFQGRSLPVLITGESGTGKEVLARWLHNHLDGTAGPFVAVNCAAIPHELAESELFGIEQGVASGVLRRAGTFQQAHGGTLFLDEVGEMEPAIQSKLLRALETRRFVRVGGHEEVPFDARIISATNAVLDTAIAAGQFREDLYWRLNGVEVRMPPLRERREDIPDLCDVFARQFSSDFGLPAPVFSRDALARLVAWHWPGNVRELKQRVGALTALSGGRVETEDLPPELRGDGAPEDGPRLSIARGPRRLRSLAELEQAHIREVLDAAGGDRRRAADILGIHRKTLGRKLREAS